MKKNTRFLSNLLLIGLATAATLPSEFKVCKLSDKKRDECLKDAIQQALVLLQNGIPRLNVPKIEPIVINSLTIGEGKGSVHLVQNYKNIEIYGISTTKIRNVKYETNSDTSNLSFNGTIEEIVFKADYDISGQILLFPVRGSGKCTIKYLNLFLSNVIIAKHYDKNGTTYSKVQQFITPLTPEKVVFNFENLFNGNEALSKQVHEIMNDEWEVLFRDNKAAMEDTLEAVFKQFANTIFDKVPYHDLFPN